MSERTQSKKRITRPMREIARSPIGMFQESMAALGANCLKASLFEEANDFLALETGKARHRETC
jgi:hypothetical protein